MAIFNSYACLPEGIFIHIHFECRSASLLDFHRFSIVILLESNYLGNVFYDLIAMALTRNGGNTGKHPSCMVLKWIYLGCYNCLEGNDFGNVKIIWSGDPNLIDR